MQKYAMKKTKLWVFHYFASIAQNKPIWNLLFILSQLARSNKQYRKPNIIRRLIIADAPFISVRHNAAVSIFSCCISLYAE